MDKPDPNSIIKVIQSLLAPNGCPWDREQTPHSLCDYLLEETFELVEAIRNSDVSEIEEELGDVFFLLFFLSILLESAIGINLQEVWDKNASKMKRRHPHVFAGRSLNDREELHQMWEEVKKTEKQEKNVKTSILDSLYSIPDSLPPLLKAYRLNAKVAKFGFTWPNDEEQKKALGKEWDEWNRAINEDEFYKREEEFGDLLFSLVEMGRRYNVKANSALHLANLKFHKRFEAMIRLAEEKRMDWNSLDLDQKNHLWEEVKRQEKESHE